MIRRGDLTGNSLARDGRLNKETVLTNQREESLHDLKEACSINYL